jgi:hypothetical protein
VVIAGAALVALLALAWLILPRFVEPRLRDKLQSLVNEHLHAELTFADLTYRFPYTVHLTDARLVARGGGEQDGHELVRLAHGKLSLDELPTGDGPLRIRQIILVRPSVHIVRGPRGEMWGGAIVKQGASADDHVERRKKLSELFRLRHLALEGGKVVFEDRGSPESAPMVWENLATNVRIEPREAARYGFRFTGSGAPLDKLDAVGAVDIDRRVLGVERLRIEAAIDPRAPASAMPAFVQELAQKHSVSGAVRIDAKGELPLRDAKGGSFHASVELRDARAKVWRFDRMLDRLSATFVCEKPGDGPQISLTINDLSATSGAAEVTIPAASGAWDGAANTWRLNVPESLVRFAGAATTGPTTAPVSGGSIALAADLHGTVDRGLISWDATTGVATIRDVTFHVPRWPAPFTNVNGTLRLGGGVAVAQHLSGTYGRDAWSFSTARIDLRDLPHGFVVSDTSGTVHFDPPSPPYPRGLGKTIEALGPSGTFSLGGSYTRRPLNPPDAWDVTVTSEGGGAFAITGRGIPLTSLRGEARVTRESIEICHLLAQSFGGAVAASGTVDPRRPISYDGTVSLRGADLAQIVEYFRGDDESGEKFAATGRLDATAQVHADRGGLEALRAGAELVVHDGDLWQIPVFGNVATEANVARDALRAGGAAAFVEVSGGVVHVRHAAVSSPALGLQGWGTLALRDAALDLDVVAAPLGDWERQLKRLKVPIVSDVAGAVAGAMQKALNTATSKLLYEFRVTGTPRAPRVTAVPTPVLTETAAMVFEAMLKREEDLMKHVRERRERQREGTR